MQEIGSREVRRIAKPVAGFRLDFSTRHLRTACKCKHVLSCNSRCEQWEHAGGWILQVIGAMTGASVGRRAAAAIEADARCTGVDELEDIDRNFHLCLLVPTRRIYLKQQQQQQQNRGIKKEKP